MQTIPLGMDGLGELLRNFRYRGDYIANVVKSRFHPIRRS